MSRAIEPGSRNRGTSSPSARAIDGGEVPTATLKRDSKAIAAKAIA